MSTNQRTNSSNDCEPLFDLVPEYAFGLTEMEETRLVDANLQNCPEAIEQLAEYRHLQEEMRASVPQIEPPSRVGDRLMAAISAPAVAAAPVPLKSRRRTIRVAWLVAVAAVMALILTNVYWLTRVADLTQSHDLLTALVNSQSSNAFVLTNTDALHWIHLADVEQQQGTASAFMMWNTQSKTGLLYARSFPALSAGNQYHLWLTRGSELISVGVLHLDADGNGALLFSSPVPIDHFTWARITAEPEVGSSQIPTGQPVVSGELNPA